MLEKATSGVRIFQTFMTWFPKNDATEQFPYTVTQFIWMSSGIGGVAFK